MTQSPDNTDRVPQEGEPEAPRRGASAQFAVAESAGAQAAMRQAMDPANQSLAEALRLSYRVLQAAIVVLVVVFVFSGFQQVKEGQTGVKTFFGGIVGEPGAEQVSPGLQPFWPYPAGEIVLLPQKDAVELTSEFWPKYPPNATTLEQAAAAVPPGEPIRPGAEGSLITADGDLAHARLTAEFTVEDSVRTLGELQPERLRDIVRRALRRGMVQAAAQSTLQELLDSRDQVAQVVRQKAQQSLDAMHSGITLGNVNLSERIAPLAVRNAYAKVQEARESGKLAVEKAQQEANRALVGMAGPGYPALLERIERYEAALTRGDLAAADAVLAEIGSRLEDRTAVGEASAIIARAQSAQANAQAMLGKEARRLQGLAASFHENPGQLVRKLWLDALRETLASPTAEVLSAPDDGGPFRVAFDSSPDIMQARRRAEVDRRRMEAEMASMPGMYLQGSSQMIIDGPGRRLQRDATKGYGRE